MQTHAAICKKNGYEQVHPKSGLDGGEGEGGESSQILIEEYNPADYRVFPRLWRLTIS